VCFYFIFIFTRGRGTPLAMQFQRSGQLVCQFKGTNSFFVFCFLFFVFNIYKRVGDSSGNAIPGEWAVSRFANLREFICVFGFFSEFFKRSRGS
jgi:hypothetical protein